MNKQPHDISKTTPRGCGTLHMHSLGQLLPFYPVGMDAPLTSRNAIITARTARTAAADLTCAANKNKRGNFYHCDELSKGRRLNSRYKVCACMCINRYDSIVYYLITSSLYPSPSHAGSQ